MTAYLLQEYSLIYGGSEMLETEAHGMSSELSEHWFTRPKHVILSSLKVSGIQPILMHDSTLYSRKNHSTEFHTFNEEQGKYIKAQNRTSYRPLFFTFVYFQVILILSMDSITVVVLMMQDAQCYTLPHNCKMSLYRYKKTWLQ